MSVWRYIEDNCIIKDEIKRATKLREPSKFTFKDSTLRETVPRQLTTGLGYGSGIVHDVQLNMFNTP